MKSTLFVSILASILAATTAVFDSSRRLSNLRRELETGPDSTVKQPATQKPPAAELEPVKVQSTASASAIEYENGDYITPDILTIAKAISAQAAILNTKTAMDATEIVDYLPHRHPFLFVDQVIDYDLNKRRIIGTKTVTVREPHFTGSFPNSATMPGVLQLEALSQLAEIFLRKMPNTVVPDGSISLTGLNGVDLKRSIVPGNILVMQITVGEGKIKAGSAEATGRAYVDGELAVVINQMMFDIQPLKNYDDVKKDAPSKMTATKKRVVGPGN